MTTERGRVRIHASDGQHPHSCQGCGSCVIFIHAPALNRCPGLGQIGVCDPSGARLGLLRPVARHIPQPLIAALSGPLPLCLRLTYLVASTPISLFTKYATIGGVAVCGARPSVPRPGSFTPTSALAAVCLRVWAGQAGYSGGTGPKGKHHGVGLEPPKGQIAWWCTGFLLGCGAIPEIPPLGLNASHGPRPGGQGPRNGPHLQGPRRKYCPRKAELKSWAGNGPISGTSLLTGFRKRN